MKTLFATLVLLCPLMCAGATPPAEAADERREPQDAAEWAYETELSRVLATSEDSSDLIMAVRFRKGGHGEAQDAPQLIARALRLEPDAAVWWRIATDCAGVRAGCNRDAAVAELQRIDADNGAVWLLPVIWTEADTDARLARIAVATRFDTYFAEWLRRYATALERVALPPALMEVDALGEGVPMTANRAQFVWAMGMTMADVMPALNGLSRACQETEQSALNAERKTLCIAALRRAMATADLYLVHRVATQRLVALLTGAERDAVEREQRRLAWQFAAWQGLHFADDGEPSAYNAEGVDALIAAWRTPHATELDAMRAQLEATGVPLDPSPDWGEDDGDTSDRPARD